MKKMNNKGFSMVELIIVIAIMAILAGALAPTLIKYVNKSRMSSDVSNAQQVAAAVQEAYSDPSSNANAACLSTGTYTIAQISGFGTLGNNFTEILGGFDGKTKYTKAGDTSMVVVISASGAGISVKIVTSGSATAKELYPNVDASYE